MDMLRIEMGRSIREKQWDNDILQSKELTNKYSASGNSQVDPFQDI